MPPTTPAPAPSTLRAELGLSLEGLQSALSRFAAHIQLRAHGAWLWQPPRGTPDPLLPPAPEPSPEETLEQIAHAICQIKYEDGQDPHASNIAPGLIVVSGEGLILAHDINHYKRRLAKVLLEMQGRKEWDIDPKTQERTLRPLREVALESFYFRRLHHFQATRELVILQESPGYHAPDYVGFTWASLRDIRRTSREQLIEELRRPHPDGLEWPHAAQDLAILTQLPAGEALAIVRPPHRTPRANIAFPSKTGAPPLRTSKIAVLPLVIEGTTLPARLRKLPPAPLPSHYRLTRSDVEIEPQPILTTLPAHRYLPAFRELKRRELRQSNSTPPHPTADQDE
jgi:hypothetical protein